MNKVPLPADIVGQILHSSADATIITDREGVIRLANDHAEALFKYDAGELIGKSIEDLIPMEHRDRHRALRDSYHESPRGRPMVSGLELYGCRKDGRTFRCEIGLNPIETDDGLLVTSTIRQINIVDDSEAYFRHLLDSAPDAMVIRVFSPVRASDRWAPVLRFLHDDRTAANSP
jgi:protein-histidine pros-kinase